MKTSDKLSTILEEIFDSSGPRAEWAYALGVTPAALSYWVSGQNIPDADHLAAIRDLAHQDEAVSDELRARFDAVLHAPLAEVVTKPRRSMGPTLRHYMVKPRMEAAMADLSALDPDLQVRLLIELGSRIEAFRRSRSNAEVLPISRVRRRHDPGALDRIERRAANTCQTMVMCR